MLRKRSTQRIFCLLFALAAMNSVAAGELAVRVLSSDGRPVPNVAVFVRQAGTAAKLRGAPKSVVMDQRDVRFVPHILVVEKGTAVEFLNSDNVAHHVYSFSRPNNFVLPLYKGTPPDPVVLDHDGIVILGCNIHDGMLGYIVVVDTNVFATTDASGSASVFVDDAASNYEISIWSPRIRDSRGPLVQNVSAVPADAVTFNLEKSLRPAHLDQSDAVQWEEY